MDSITTVAGMGRLCRNAATCRYPDDQTAEALRTALADSPDDTTLALVLADRYCELGASRKTALLWAERTRRWGVCLRALKATTAKAGRLRSRIRAGWPPCVGIKLVGYERSDEGPTHQGSPPETTFRGGGACKYPGAAIRAGYKVDYTPDSRNITVGVAWLYRLLEEEFACLL